MPIDLTGGSVFELVDTVAVLYAAEGAGAADTTINDATGVDAGDKTLTVDSETGFEEGDYLNLGSGNDIEIGLVASTAAGSIVLVSGVANDHPDGAPVVRLARSVMGHIAEGGVTHDVEEERFQLDAANDDRRVIDRVRRREHRITWPNLNHDIEARALAAGASPSTVHGTGTEADPYVFDWKQMDTLRNAGLHMTGSLKDTRRFEIFGWGVDWELAGTRTFSRNTGAEVPTGGRVKGGRDVIYTPA